jgi:glycosyltransferase involved in cell wall biosynthesis
MTATPRVVFGMPVFNRADALPEALESLLTQTYRDFALVVVDDGPSAATAAVVERYRRLDPRITYEVNPVRLGMIGNWRKCFDRARTLYPAARYFAWASDHDAWHPRWIEVLIDVLERHPEVALAYPLTLRTFDDAPPRINRSFETFGVVSPRERLRQSCLRMTAGNIIYGLFRVDALAQAGVFRPVLFPDRQVLLELALLGQFRQVPELLWYREVARGFSFDRQRVALFSGRTPAYAYLPTHVTHFAVLLWDLGVRARGRPAFGRLAGLRYAVLQLRFSIQRELEVREWSRSIARKYRALVDRATAAVSRVSRAPGTPEVRARRRETVGSGEAKP